MQVRTCSKCGSPNVYKNMSGNWHQNGLLVKVIGTESFDDLFKTEAFLCLDCRHLDIQVLETTTRFDVQKTLAEAIPASRNWEKA